MELYFQTVGHENQILHRFDYETISVATGNFSDQNKISPFASDSLYKGKLQNGQDIALLYLHKDAPIRVIHCDVRSGNILLDESLDPKLSNFGTARCLARDESDCYMPMTRGTCGYTAPECLSGYFSTGADVYSFGVSCLETITGRRANRQLLETNQSLEEYVYRNVLKGTHLHVIDPKMDVDSSLMGRLFEIGLLCTQYRPNHRPTMEEVVDMLHTGYSHTIPKGSGMMYTIFKDAMWFLSDKDYEVSAGADYLSQLSPR
nr:serine-threonine/tyrosine-protein kinase catalytic domain-containing protein [Tanacetum cinerariifolium]